MALAGLVLPLVGCGSVSPKPPAPHFEVSYAAAAGWLSGMKPPEVDEQLRDWARTALAAHLNLDTASFLGTAYDTLPVRDPGFADLSRQETGPGRLLVDGKGMVHLLVPLGDPHEARTVGLLLDQYRADHGADSQQVVIDRYQLRRDLDAIEVTDGTPRPTPEVRSAYGYVMMRIDSMGELTGFLAKTQYLSEISIQGSKIWASGWRWPDVPSAPLDAADVSAIQGGYPVRSDGQAPGFSLDPEVAQRPEDVKAVIPDLAPTLIDSLRTNDWTGTPFQSADDLGQKVESALFDGDPSGETLTRLGLPSDRAQLWAIHQLIQNKAVYSQARYEGGLAQTDVGMTLFYTDYVAKDWVAGVGSGVPTAAVGGFVPDTDAVTPWSHCPSSPQVEWGRLWFGQNDAAFARSGDRIDIGAQATRLFARSDGAHGAEVEPSFAFGRGLRFWDQHYQAIADYEPQYARLDQIMRWSGALEWLTGKGDALPTAPDGDVHHPDLTFKDWYAQHSELRERAPISFVTPPGANQEAVISSPTKTFENCGFSAIKGGVSLSDLSERAGERSYHADLPEPWRRAGLFDEASHADPSSGDGVITQLAIDDAGQKDAGQKAEQVKRTISTTGDRSEVKVDASHRAVIPFRNVKVWRSDAADRMLTASITASRGQVSQHVDYQGQDLGTLDVRSVADVVAIQWRRGVVDRALRVLQALQDWLANPFHAYPRSVIDGLSSVTDGSLETYQDADGQVRVKVGGPGDPWLTIRDGTQPSGDDLAFRIGAPDLNSPTPRFFEATFAAGPHAAGGPQSWWDVASATGDQAAQGSYASPPAATDPAVPVSTPDGRTANLVIVDDGDVRVPSDDPILGPDGLPEGAALLAAFPRVFDAMDAAAMAGDGFLRGVLLEGDGVALAGADRVIIVPANHPWAERVRRAVAADPGYAMPLMQIVGDRVEHVDTDHLTPVPGSTQHKVRLEEVLSRPDISTIYMHESLRSTLHLQGGTIIPEPLPGALRVQVNVIAVVPLHPVHNESAAAQPDVRIHQHAQWSKFNTYGNGFQSNWQNATPTPVAGAPATAGGGTGQAAGMVLLVCPAAGPFASACGG